MMSSSQAGGVVEDLMDDPKGSSFGQRRIYFEYLGMHADFSSHSQANV
jgi:hypothetical protein